MKRRTILHRLFALAVACCLVTGMTEHVRAQRKEASQEVILKEKNGASSISSRKKILSPSHKFKDIRRSFSTHSNLPSSQASKVPS